MQSLSFKGKTYQFTDEAVDEMRTWVSDCQWEDIESEEIEDLPLATLVSGIESNYDGGLFQFLRDCYCTAIIS
jgi:hypothetical protein